MKKLISLITSGMLATMSMIPLTITADIKAFSANESKTADIMNTSTVSNVPNSEEFQVASTQAPLKTDELRVYFDVDEPEYDVYVGEQIDLNDIIFNLSIYGYFPDGKFQASPTSLNYSFSIGSGKHSDCYTYDMSDLDTSKAGRYLIRCKLHGGVKETFDIENSGSPDVPDGKYEMIMENSNFNIHINVIDPNVTSPTVAAATTTHSNSNIHNHNTTAASSPVENVTEPQSSGIVTGCQTTRRMVYCNCYSTSCRR